MTSGGLSWRRTISEGRRGRSDPPVVPVHELHVLTGETLDGEQIEFKVWDVVGLADDGVVCVGSFAVDESTIRPVS